MMVMPRLLLLFRLVLLLVVRLLRLQREVARQPARRH